MRLPLGAALVAWPLATALAQQAPSPPPLPTVQTPGSPRLPAPGEPGTPAPDQPPPAAAVPPPPAWLPRGVADLVALDKVTARATALSVRVGQSATFGTLTIAVRVCDTRPPDQPADATAYLDIADTHLGGPQFHGWMVVSAPALSMLEHPIYDVRLVGCHD